MFVQAHQGGLSVRSPAELAPAVGHREVWRRPATGAAGLSGAAAAAGTEQRHNVTLYSYS